MPAQSTAPAVVYKDVPGFPGYRVGDDGTPWTCWVKNGNKPAILGDKWIKMSPFPTVYGYMQVSLFRNRKRFAKKLHTLILETFVGPCPPGHECAHDNGIRHDCRLSNLAWKTKLENAADKKRHGTNPAGERHPLAKLTTAQVEEIREKSGTLSQAELGRQYGITQGTVSRLISKRRWPHV